MALDARELAATFDLEKLPPYFYANPYPTYRALRETEPVAAAERLLFPHPLCRPCDGVQEHPGLQLGQEEGVLAEIRRLPLHEHHTTSLVFNDPPAHTRVRRLIMGALTPRAIADMEPGLSRWSTACSTPSPQGSEGGRPDRGFRRRHPGRGHRQPARGARRTSASPCATGRWPSSARWSR